MYECVDTSSWFVLICSSGTYQNKTGQKLCLPCKVGFICAEGSTTDTPDSGRCPKGYFCADPTTATPCPKGKYGSKEGAISEADGCQDCPQGQRKNINVLIKIRNLIKIMLCHIYITKCEKFLKIS